MLTDGVLDGEVVVVTERVTELLEEIEFEVDGEGEELAKSTGL